MNFTYSGYMVEGSSFLELKVDLKEPAELYDLVMAFTSLGRQFDQYIKSDHPNYDGETKIYVKQIRQGSIIAELLPVIQPLVQTMDTALIIDSFIGKYGSFLKRYSKGRQLEDASKSDLDDFMGQVAAIAKDPNGSIALSSVEFEKTKSKVRASVKFNSRESRRIEESAAAHKKEIEAKAYEIHNNVLLVFWQSNLKEAEVGKRSGEKAIVEAVSSKPLAVIYDSDLAEERIKHETKDGDRNLYKLGFM